MKFWKGYFYVLCPLFFLPNSPNNFVSFQYILLKFGMHVHDIKIHFLFSTYYHNFLKIKKYWEKTSIFHNISSFLQFSADLELSWLFLFLLDLVVIPLSAFYFFYFQCCYQLSKAKKLFKKIWFLSRDITNKNSFLYNFKPW